jgi:hypothetical protein
LLLFDLASHPPEAASILFARYLAGNLSQSRNFEQGIYEAGAEPWLEHEMQNQ